MAVFCMYGDLTIRKVRTGSGAIAVQVVKYVKRKCVIVRHIGSANTDDELTVCAADKKLDKKSRGISNFLC